MAHADKARREQLAQDLYRRRDQSDVRAMLDLLNIMVEECKSSLVTCQDDQFKVLQGEAQAYIRLVRQLTRPASSRQPHNEG